MTINEFTSLLEKEFEEIEQGALQPDTNYRDIKNWSSMHALIIIAFADAHFNVELTANDLRNAQTIRDLYNVIQTKQNN